MKIEQENILSKFKKLRTLSDLAEYLGFAPQKFSYILYKLNGGPDYQYHNFAIKKRSGGCRQISSPDSRLKSLQRCLADKLYDIYLPKKAVNGFVRKRTILTNAQVHSRKKYVFKIDLKDFFPSIHYGRIRGLLIANPYGLHWDIASLIAKIACLDGKLPQGSPCSPIISNMICAFMDHQLTELAKVCGCYYTRYADDLTFSTNKKEFPCELAICEGGIWHPGGALSAIIEKNSFSINVQKTLMRTRSDRQLVTGIVVNDYPNTPELAEAGSRHVA